MIVWGKNKNEKQYFEIRSQIKLSETVFSKVLDGNEIIYDCDYEHSMGKVILRVKATDNSTMSIFLITDSSSWI